jgi:hypothetical protein
MVFPALSPAVITPLETLATDELALLQVTVALAGSLSTVRVVLAPVARVTLCLFK